jgi:preprotein translocase subunit SecF
MRFFKKTNIDFLGARKFWYIFSAIMVSIGIFSVIFGFLGPGIDFQGGTEIVLTFPQKITIDDIRTSLAKVGMGTSEIIYYGGENSVLIRTSEQAEGSTISDRIKIAVQTAFPDKKFEVAKEDKIGPKIGKELRLDAVYALLWSFVGILVYVGFRFKFAYGFGAVIALVHDVSATCGFLAIVSYFAPGLNINISQDVIAALLTIIGTSVNDTVVIFDRVRENEKIYRSMPLYDVMNRSLNDTLSRTIITNGTIFAVLLILLLFGGDVIRPFALAMFFGSISGTYSTIYVAGAFVIDYTRFRNRKTALVTA